MITADLVVTRLDGSVRAIESLRAQSERVAAIGDLLIDRLRAGGTIFTAGNGGSAADALHFAEELIGRYRASRAPLRAICLNADATVLTCIANDFGFDQVFARQCEALLTPADVLVVFSTSGESANILEALRIARDRGAVSIGLLGRDGGAARKLCDHSIIVPASDSAHIQEAHQVVLHLLCEFIEQAMTR